MDLERFKIYEKNGKKGILDVKLNKVVLDCKFNVESFEGENIILKNGKTYSLRGVLERCDYFSSKMRYCLVEDDETKLMGIYDVWFDKLTVCCNCLKIEFLPKERAFLIVKEGNCKKLPYEKLQHLNFKPTKIEKIITLNNLSLYFGKQIRINSKTGKKVEINR